MSKTAGLRYLGIGAIAFVAIGLASPTWASISFTAGVGDSPVAGVSYVNFDDLVPPAGGPSGGGQRYFCRERPKRGWQSHRPSPHHLCSHVAKAPILGFKPMAWTRRPTFSRETAARVGH